MGETIIVVLIVAAVAVMAGRSLYRTLTGKVQGCGCKAGCCMSGDCSGHCQGLDKEPIGIRTRTKADEHG